ncbi:substrate-binding periplasmic protein [Oceanospirillum sediminis]|uniref:Transporter substrate-binding domain-containing protein n=1 Tax=Oceanospirillum sediminis TaxID=2760088 RepID=A0A839IPW6_9GAMM|nr:transporter substrate-binding domain-containing protein [Oceanospirillum sediminis]MBB1487543.1 transporter substrate-binding domain-containing protein [Oceanospirillum sediminis]
MKYYLFIILVDKAVGGRMAICRLSIFIITFLFSAFSQGGSKPFTLVYANHWSPYSFVDKEGQAKGILVDIADYLLGHQLDIPVQHIALPWKRAQSMVRSGKYDALITAPTADRKMYSFSSESVLYKLQWRAYISALTPNYEQLLTMDNPLSVPARCIMLLGDLTSERIYTKYRQKCLTVKNLSNAVKMLQMGRADLFVHARAIMNQQLQSDGIADTITAHPSVLREVAFHLLVNKSSDHAKYLPEKLDQYLNSAEGMADYQGFLRLLDTRTYYARILP